jgi:hypothetical protein
VDKRMAMLKKRRAKKQEEKKCMRALAAVPEGEMRQCTKWIVNEWQGRGGPSSGPHLFSYRHLRLGDPARNLAMAAPPPPPTPVRSILRNSPPDADELASMLSRLTLYR